MFKSVKAKGSFEEQYVAEQKQQSRNRFKQSVKAAVGKTFRGTRRAKFATYAGVLIFAGVGTYGVVQSFAATSKEAGWVTIAVRDAQTGQPIPNSWVGVANVNPNGTNAANPLNCYSGSDINQKQMANGTTAFHCHVGSNNVEDFRFSFNAGQGYKPNLSAPDYVGYAQKTVKGSANCSSNGDCPAGSKQHFDFYLHKVPAPAPAPGGVTPSKATLMKDPVYRMYRSASNSHFYTTNVDEYNAAVKFGYAKEGNKFYAASKEGEGLVPVYRMYRSASNSHFYTTNVDEYNAAVKFGYAKEGIKFYASNKTDAGLTPVYRMYRSASNSHFYTTNVDEYNAAVKFGYAKEGIKFYAKK